MVQTSTFFYHLQAHLNKGQTIATSVEANLPPSYSQNIIFFYLWAVLLFSFLPVTDLGEPAYYQTRAFETNMSLE